jgi:hypothetical protein
MAMYAGQSLGVISAVAPAAAILERFSAGLRTS